MQPVKASEIAENREVSQVFLGLLPRGHSPQESGYENQSMNVNPKHEIHFVYFDICFLCDVHHRSNSM